MFPPGHTRHRMPSATAPKQGRPSVPTPERRGLADPVGYAHLARQIEAVVQRIAAQDGAKLERILRSTTSPLATAGAWRSRRTTTMPTPASCTRWS